MFYFVVIYWGFAAKYINCADFDPRDFTTIAAVLAAEAPKLIYFMAGVAAFYFKEIFFWAFSLGITLNEIVFMLGQLVVPEFSYELPACQHAESARPSHEAAIMTYTALYHVAYHMQRSHVTLTDWVYVIINVVSAVLTCVSLVFLGTFDTTEVLVGAAYGVIPSAIVVYLLYRQYLPHPDRPLFQYLVSVFGIESGKIVFDVEERPAREADLADAGPSASGGRGDAKVADRPRRSRRLQLKPGGGSDWR